MLEASRRLTNNVSLYEYYWRTLSSCAAQTAGTSLLGGLRAWDGRRQRMRLPGRHCSGLRKKMEK